jgi:hypothetical protein
VEGLRADYLAIRELDPSILQAIVFLVYFLFILLEYQQIYKNVVVSYAKG